MVSIVLLNKKFTLSGQVLFTNQLYHTVFRLSLPLAIIGRKQHQLVEALIHLMSMRDPVCGTVLDGNTAKFKISYEGDTYHFCSLVCKKRFKRQPTKFVK